MEVSAMRQENVELHEELRRHMAAAFEDLRHDLRRIRRALNAIEQNFTGRMDDREKRMDKSFADLQHALIEAGLAKPLPTRQRTKPN
jgi:predicted nuclease with TOPRIM domain